MSVAIPIEPGIPHQVFSVDLDGSTYILELRWNSRAEEWFIEISDSEDEPIGATKLALGALLFGRSVDPRLPPGQLLALDTSGSDEDAGFDDLGRRVQLVYFDAATIAV